MPLITENIKEFIEVLPTKSRLIGLDFGDKTIGVAVSNDNLSIATPMTVINRKKLTKDMEQVIKIIKEEELQAIVVGLPLQMDGSSGLRVQKTLDFTHRLSRFCNLPIFLQDERLSTIAMKNFLINEADVSRKKRAKVIDKSAACFILKGALDAIRLQG